MQMKATSWRTLYSLGWNEVGYAWCNVLIPLRRENNKKQWCTAIRVCLRTPYNIKEGCTEESIRWCLLTKILLYGGKGVPSRMVMQS